MYGERKAIEKKIIVCSVCGGQIPYGCTCFGGTWVKEFSGSGWRWVEHKDKKWVGKNDPDVKIRFKQHDEEDIK